MVDTERDKTDNNYHIPGYDGHVPQLQYKCGRGFSHTTHKLLSDPNVDKSPNSLLPDIQSCRYESQVEEHKRNILKHRTGSYGDQRLVFPLVPGYTGVIPRENNYPGKTFAQSSLSALAEFEVSQRYEREKRRRLQALTHPQCDSSTSADSTEAADLKINQPLRKIRPDMTPYVSKKPYSVNGSPFEMQNSDPEKRFMSGYMGFVPRSHEFFGMDYAGATHAALNRFTDSLKKQKFVLSTPVELHRAPVSCVTDSKLYPETSGLVPKYTGHVPGERFKFGQTFFQSTENAADRFTPDRLLWSHQLKTTLISQ